MGPSLQGWIGSFHRGSFTIDDASEAMDASLRENVMHETICRTFLVSLNSEGSEGRVFLSDLAEELRQERGAAEGPLRLDQGALERLIMERLSSDQPEGGENLFLYLLECYGRVQEESRRAERYKDKEFGQQVQRMLEFARELIVSYSGILLQTDMFPQDSKYASRGSLQILDCILAPSGNILPPGYLDSFIARFDGEGLKEMFEPIIVELVRSVSSCSLLGEYHSQLSVIQMLSMFPAVCKIITTAMVNWIPVNCNGRQFEQQSVLGPLLSISAIPDPILEGVPNVRKSCFSDIDNMRNVDIHSSIATLRNSSEGLATTLHSIYMNLLRRGDRQRVLDHFAAAINSNVGRSKIQIDVRRTASHGFMMNLSRILLKICEPFVNDRGLKLGRLDPDYLNHGRIDFSSDTKLAATSEQEASWLDHRNASRVENFRNTMKQHEQHTLNDFPSKEQEASGSQATAKHEFHFVCESFFLTVRCLHLGLVRCIRYEIELIKAMQKQQQALEELESSGRSPLMGGSTAQRLMVERQIQELKAVISEYKEVRLCFDALLMEPVARGLEPEFPLPLPCPMEFAVLPEHFVDDITTVLLYIIRASPAVLNSVQNELEEFVDFLIVFVGSPSHIKNPYKRADMVEVLHACIPRDNAHFAPPKSLQLLLEAHPLSIKHLVPNLLRLYVDIEFTGSHTQFYDKFNIRHNIGEILEYLWGVHTHREEWCKIASMQGNNFYLKFLNMVINDAIYLLDESVKKLPEVRQTLHEMADATGWRALSEREREEREATLRQTEQILRSDLYLAGVHLRMLQYTSSEITQPFLCSEMVDRIASMLDYFLVQFLEYLSGTRTLELHELEKYGFIPSELLSRLADVFINLFNKDSQGVLAAAIARDGRSYRHGLFQTLARVAREYFLLSEDKVLRMEMLGAKVEEAKATDADDEEMLGDIPDEFLDPIQYTIMKDPVRLPTSGVVLDRSTIMRHLLSDPTDPFSRKPLSPEMLLADVELKLKIENWIVQQRSHVKR